MSVSEFGRPLLIVATRRRYLGHDPERAARGLFLALGDRLTSGKTRRLGRLGRDPRPVRGYGRPLEPDGEVGCARVRLGKCRRGVPGAAVDLVDLQQPGAGRGLDLLVGGRRGASRPELALGVVLRLAHGPWIRRRGGLCRRRLVLVVLALGGAERILRLGRVCPRACRKLAPLVGDPSWLGARAVVLRRALRGSAARPWGARSGSDRVRVRGQAHGWLRGGARFGPRRRGASQPRTASPPRRWRRRLRAARSASGRRRSRPASRSPRRRAPASAPGRSRWIRATGSVRGTRPGQTERRLDDRAGDRHVNTCSMIRCPNDGVSAAIEAVGRAAAGRLAERPRLGKSVIRQGRRAAARNGVRGHRDAHFARGGASGSDDEEECGTCGDAQDQAHRQEGEFAHGHAVRNSIRSRPSPNAAAPPGPQRSCERAQRQPADGGVGHAAEPRDPLG